MLLNVFKAVKSILRRNFALHPTPNFIVMNKMHLIFYLFGIVLLTPVQAQFVNEDLPEELQLDAKDTTIVEFSLVSLGFNIIMDTGKQFKSFPGSSDEWHIVPYPSRLSYGKYFRNGLGLEGILALNRFMEGKLVEGQPLTADRSYFSIDSRLSYNLDRLFKRSGWFDPYVGTGLGYTSVEGSGGATINGVIGFRTWISDQWGIDLNTTGKWSLGDAISNHIQYGAGVAYRFDIEKDLTREGKDKLVHIQQYLAEEQRKLEEAAAQEKAREEARLEAERLAREEEEARLAAIAAREKSERDLNDAIAKKLEDAGFAYYNFDSSYLTQGAKDVLDQVVEFMTEYPTVTIKLTAHADSRGAVDYNQWLSDRRAKRALDYLVERGIAAERVIAEGKGETELRNDCKDGVPCPEDKHSENRRSQFIVFSFEK